jgi:hypothetical protein
MRGGLKFMKVLEDAGEYESMGGMLESMKVQECWSV